MIAITEKDFSLDKVVRSTVRPSMGAAVIFLGTVRDMTKGKRVHHLEFEADNQLAIEELKRIRDEAIEKFGVSDVSIIHRVGHLELGENIVLIVVGAAHRDEAFKACRYAIDQLKQRALIWKKEFTEEKSYWVGDVESE